MFSRWSRLVLFALFFSLIGELSAQAALSSAYPYFGKARDGDNKEVRAELHVISGGSYYSEKIEEYIRTEKPSAEALRRYIAELPFGYPIKYDRPENYGILLLSHESHPHQMQAGIFLIEEVEDGIQDWTPLAISEEGLLSVSYQASPALRSSHAIQSGEGGIEVRLLNQDSSANSSSNSSGAYFKPGMTLFLRQHQKQGPGGISYPVREREYRDDLNNRVSVRGMMVQSQLRGFLLDGGRKYRFPSLRGDYRLDPFLGESVTLLRELKAHSGGTVGFVPGKVVGAMLATVVGDSERFLHVIDYTDSVTGSLFYSAVRLKMVK